MSALDDAIEASWDEVKPETAIRIVVERGLLIPADDREGLLAALGAEQIGWHHTTDELCIGSFVTEDCPECVPVYKVQP